MARRTQVFSIAWEPEELKKIEYVHQNSSYRCMSLGTFIRFLALSALDDMKKQTKEATHAQQP